MAFGYLSPSIIFHLPSHIHGLRIFVPLGHVWPSDDFVLRIIYGLRTIMAFGSLSPSDVLWREDVCGLRTFTA